MPVYQLKDYYNCEDSFAFFKGHFVEDLCEIVILSLVLVSTGELLSVQFIREYCH